MDLWNTSSLKLYSCIYLDLFNLEIKKISHSEILVNMKRAVLAQCRVFQKIADQYYRDE